MDTPIYLGAPLGMTSKERARFALGNLVAAHLDRDEAALAAFRDVSAAAAAQSAQPPRGFGSFVLPAESLSRRDLTAASASGGGYLRGTETDFAGALFARSIAARLPMRQLRLQGDLSIGAGVAVSTAWQSNEGAAISHSDPDYTTAAATPRTVGCVVNISRRLWQQLGDAGRAFVEVELARAMAAAIDRALLHGNGVEEPLGLFVASGTTSASGTSITYDTVCSLLQASEGYAADGVHFILGTSAARILRGRAKTSGGTMVFESGTIDGVPTIVSKACDDAALVVAPFSRIIAASWSGLEVAITERADATAFRTGTVSIRLMQSLDFLIEKPALVGKAVSIT